MHYSLALRPFNGGQNLQEAGMQVAQLSHVCHDHDEWEEA